MVIIKKIENWFYIYLLACPWLDLMTSLMTRYTTLPMTIGMLIRGLFILLMVGYSLKYRKARLYYGLIALYVILSGHIIHEVVYFFKYFYFPILLVAVSTSMSLDQDKVYKCLVSNAIVMALGILIPTITQTGGASYVGMDKQGTVGWFYAANEVGAIFALLFPAIYYLLWKGQYLAFIIIVLSCITSMLLLGTKVGLLAVLGIEALMVLWFLIHRHTQKGISLCLIIFIMSIVVMPILPTMHNVSEALPQVAQPQPQQESRQITNVVLSSRQIFLKETYDIYASSPLSNKLLGIGFNHEKLIEMDIFDIFFRYGIIGFIIYFLPLIHIKFHKLHFISLVALVFGLGIATLAGHVLGAPPVSTYLVMHLCLNQPSPY